MRKVMSFFLAFALICGLFHTSFAAGNENLSMLTYKELLALQSDVSAEYKANHSPTDAQKNFVLNTTKTEAQRYYAKKGLDITGWAWYDSEYTYTKDWDFYTLSTHLDYKDSSQKSHQAKIYSEAYYKNGKFILSYLTTDKTVILDNRSDYEGILWFTEPQAKINKETGIDLSKYTAKELNALYNRADKQIEATHSVSGSERNTILGYTKLELEQYLLEKNYELRGYAWYDNEYTYIKDWDYYWLETHVDYRNSSGSSKTDKLFSEFCKINGELELVYLKMGSAVIVDRRNELATTMDNGIPRYSWVGSTDTIVVDSDIESSRSVIATEEKDEVSTNETETQNPERQDKPADIVISFDNATDEELEEAINKIRTEQRARLKTKIILSEESIAIEKGKTAKITAEVIDIPEDQKASQIKWDTSDKNVATIQNGSITGRTNGKTTITASCTLTDGTEISSECVVTVYTSVKSLQVSKKTIDLGVGESTKIEVAVQPKDATNPALKWESSDNSIVSVSADGTITGKGQGTATITATTTDGSEKKVSITVKSTKKDDRGKTLTNSDGVALTVLSVKQTKGSGYSKAEAGNTFVLIELQIENNTSSEISINSTFGFDAICDDYSVDYSFSADVNTNNSISTTDLKPGRKLKGWKGFEVPQNWKELIVTFTPDASIWGSGEKIEFVIYNN